MMLASPSPTCAITDAPDSRSGPLTASRCANSVISTTDASAGSSASTNQIVFRRRARLARG